MNRQLLQRPLKQLISLIAIASGMIAGSALAAQTGQGPTSESPALSGQVSPVPSPEPVTPSVPTAPATPTAVPEVPAMPATPKLPATQPAVPARGADTTGTIVDVAASHASFKTLAKAVKAAGLESVLGGKEPYTIFAPTDAAFAALPKGTVDRLLKPENKEALKKVLTYHVIPGAVTSTALKPGEVTTVEGNPVRVRLTGQKVTVNNAQVTTPDIKATNGVIHVIDRVIVPPDLPNLR